MINKISKEINRELKYIEEIHLPFFSFDSVQFLLNDDESNKYLLVLAFNQKDIATIKNSNCLFKGFVTDIFCGLFSYPLEINSSANCNADYSNIVCKEFTESDKQLFSLNMFNTLHKSSNNYILISGTSCLPVSIQDNKAVVGTWMNHFGRILFLKFCQYIFNNFKNVKIIEYSNLVYNPELDMRYWRHNDYYLPLPKSIDELKLNISSKSRHNLRRERRIIEDEFGSLELKNIPFKSEDIKIANLFYEFKNKTHSVSKADYDITKLPITDVYLLNAGDDIKGIALSCEQSKIAFIENHTFDSSLRQYSFGQVLYDMYLEALIKKGKIGVALAGGNLEYKKRYGSVCYNAYSGKINRTSMRLFKVLEKNNYDVTNKKYHRMRTVYKLFHK